MVTARTFHVLSSYTHVSERAPSHLDWPPNNKATSASSLYAMGQKLLALGASDTILQVMHPGLRSNTRPLSTVVLIWVPPSKEVSDHQLPPETSWHGASSRSTTPRCATIDADLFNITYGLSIGILLAVRP